MFSTLRISPVFFRQYEEKLKVDLIEKENEYALVADLPGIDKKDIELTMSSEGVLSIEVKHKEQLNRCFAFNNINIENVEASINNGVMKVTIPKNTDEKKERSIQIK